MPDLTDADDLPPMKDGTIVLGIVLLQIVIVAMSVQRFPGSLWQGGGVYEFGSICALFAYAGIAYAVRGIESDPARHAVRVGTVLGVSYTVLTSVLYFFASHLTTLHAILTITWGDAALLVVLFVVAALVAARRNPLMAPIMLSCTWVAVVGTACSLLLGSRRMLLPPHLGSAALETYENSGMTDPQAYVIREALHGMPGQLISPLVEATLVGGIVAWFVLLLGKRKTREYAP